MKGHANLRNAKLSPHQHQLPYGTPQLLSYCFYPLQVLPPFFNTQGTTFETCSHPQAAANQHSLQWLSTHTHTHPKAHSHPPKDTHCSHESEIQQACLLSRTQHPFLLSHPFQSKTAPQRALFALLCSLPWEGRAGRPLAYGNCETSILIVA